MILLQAVSPDAMRRAMRAAYHSTALVDTDHRAMLDAVTGYALLAHAQATGGARQLTGVPAHTA